MRLRERVRHNRESKSFIWTLKDSDIVEMVRRARKQLKSYRQADKGYVSIRPLLFANRSGAIVRKDRLGGLLTMYHRVAA